MREGRPKSKTPPHHTVQVSDSLCKHITVRSWFIDINRNKNIMKVAVVLFFFVSMLGEAHLLSPFASSGSSTGSVVVTSDGASGRHVTSSSEEQLNRKLLKEQEVVLEDYGVIDPTPATKTSVGPKPIDHGSPLIPFIPQQPPPTPTYDALSPPTD